MNDLSITDEEIEKYLHEDAPFGDITSAALIQGNRYAKAYVQCKEDCVVAGLEEAKRIFEHLGCNVTLQFKDGDTIEKFRKVMFVAGDASKILLGERLALNFLMRMSGIATMTAELVKMAREVNPEIRVAATRKTTPGFRKFEKKAVMIGGGEPHRFSLSDAVLIKENHIAVVGDIEEAVKLARNISFTKKIEVEVKTMEEAVSCARLGVDIIMLDNFKLSDAEEAYRKIKEINRGIVVEVSGGVNRSNIKKYARCCDVISAGMLTHSARAIDFSLEVV
ncbi:MAG: carboxylating nicotinate-nucleotide diphosphorylase [Thermoplasmata archaeon]|nr:carboxylating nicotinate-nucleotide diphosphorylase [Thermoplasmata archaeon]